MGNSECLVIPGIVLISRTYEDGGNGFKRGHEPQIKFEIRNPKIRNNEEIPADAEKIKVAGTGDLEYQSEFEIRNPKSETRKYGGAEKIKVAARKQGFGISIGKGSKLGGKLHPVSILKVMLFVVRTGAVLGGFAFLDKYVKEQMPVTPGGRTIELVGETPGWVTEEIKNRVYAAASVDDGRRAN